MRKSDLVEEIIDVVGHDAALILFKRFGGLSFKIPLDKRCGLFALKLIEVIGEEAALKIIGHFCGERLTIPKGFERTLHVRNKEIISSYSDGVSVNDLVSRYNLTERQIRNILAGASNELRRKQLSIKRISASAK